MVTKYKKKNPKVPKFILICPFCDRIMVEETTPNKKQLANKILYNISCFKCYFSSKRWALLQYDSLIDLEEEQGLNEFNQMLKETLTEELNKMGIFDIEKEIELIKDPRLTQKKLKVTKTDQGIRIKRKC